LRSGLLWSNSTAFWYSDTVFFFSEAFQVEQKFSHEINKYRKDVYFNGNIIGTRTNQKLEDIFTGPLDIYISDKWHVQGGHFNVSNFLYESF
jgi:hypothetical protein